MKKKNWAFSWEGARSAIAMFVSTHFPCLAKQRKVLISVTLRSNLSSKLSSASHFLFGVPRKLRPSIPTPSPDRILLIGALFIRALGGFVFFGNAHRGVKGE